MADNDLLAQLLGLYGPEADARTRYREPSLRDLTAFQMPTLPLLPHEADAVEQPEPNPVTSALRTAAGSVGANAYPFYPGAPSLSGMFGDGLGSAANWLDQRPEVGPDTLAPLGLAAAGPLSALRLMEHPTRAAVRSAGRTFTGRTHMDAVDDGIRHLGEKRFWKRMAKGYGDWRDNPGDGFVTSEGRLVSRTEASQLMREAIQGRPQRKHEPQFSYPSRGESNRLDRLRERGINRVYEEPNTAILFADSSRASLPGIVVNGMQQGGPRLTLSENLQSTLRPDSPTTNQHGHPLFYYHLLQDGQKIGSAAGHVAGDTAHVGWIGASGRENTLGPAAMRQLREAFRSKFPDVVNFEGGRVSGARAKSANTFQTVRMKSEAGGLPLPTQAPQPDDGILSALLEMYGLPR